MNFEEGSHGRWSRVSRIIQWSALGVFVVLIVVRMFMPHIVERYVNRQLNHTRDYGSRIGDVSIELWRGRYRINAVQIFKRTGGIRVPLFAADQVALSIQWKELFHGSLVGQVEMQRPSLNFVSGPTEEQTQTGKDESWSEVLGSLFPFKINRLDVVDGQVHFRNEHSAPPVDIFFYGMSATATNLTNARSLNRELPAGVEAHATTLGGGGLDLHLQLNPLAPAPTYQVTAQLTNVDLVALNDFLKAYGKFDVERGEFALFTSVAAKEGSYEGYLKVFFEHLDVFAWEKERGKNVLQIFWQAIVGAVTTILKNQSTDSLATRVPISGSYGTEKIGTWTAIASLLQNAFIRALVPKLDEHVTVRNVEEKLEGRQHEPDRRTTAGAAEKPKMWGSPFPEKGGPRLAQPPH